MPTGGSATCSSKVCPKTVTSPPTGTMAKRQEGGQDRQVGRQLEDGPIGALGKEVLLEEELDPVRQGLQQPPRTGPVGPDARLHVRDHLALEPDHQHDRHQQGPEGHEHLDDDDEELHPVDAVRVEGVAETEEPARHSVSSRTSMTAWRGVDQRRRAGTRCTGVVAAEVEVDAGDTARHPVVGDGLELERGARRADPDPRRAVVTPRRPRSWGLARTVAAAASGARELTRLDQHAVVVEPPRRHEPQRVAVGAGQVRGLDRHGPAQRPGSWRRLTVGTRRAVGEVERLVATGGLGQARPAAGRPGPRRRRCPAWPWGRTAPTRRAWRSAPATPASGATMPSRAAGVSSTARVIPACEGASRSISSQSSAALDDAEVRRRADRRARRRPSSRASTGPVTRASAPGG